MNQTLDQPASPPLAENRSYPARPILAASAAIIRDGKVLTVRRARPPAFQLYTMPGGVVEVGETLTQAVVREVLEETALTVAPVGIAGHRDIMARDDAGRIERHFVIVCFACRWIAGEPVLNEELADWMWATADDIAGLETTEGLGEIVDAAFALMRDVAGEKR